jgi:hypothetical protein
VKVRELQPFYPDRVYRNILGISIDVKFHIDIGGGHIDIESFYRFKKILTDPAPN